MNFILKIKCTSNNTILTLTNSKLKTLITVSTGKVGFKGAKRSTFIAAERAATEIAKYIGKFKKPYNFILSYNGIGRGKRAILKGLKKRRINIKKIVNNTHVPHNGCRPSKKRRL